MRNQPAVEQGVDDGSPPRAGRRVHDHARRFVDRHHVVVLVENPQRQVFGRRARRRRRRRIDDEPLAAAEREACLARPAVDLHAAGVDPALGLGATERGLARRQEYVETDRLRQRRDPNGALLAQIFKTSRARTASRRICSTSACGEAKRISPRSRSTSSTRRRAP